MLDLRSPRWKELSHAYGSAQDIPGLLLQLKSAPPKKDYQSEPWFSLWSALCHQGDVYAASYAAVPHLMAIGSDKPVAERVDFLLLCASIEAQRHVNKASEMPSDFKGEYDRALRTGRDIALDCLKQDEWSEEDYRVLFGALAIFRGQVPLGNMLLNSDGDCQCPNCDTVFPPLGYDILENE